MLCKIINRCARIIIWLFVDLIVYYFVLLVLRYCKYVVNDASIVVMPYFSAFVVYFIYLFFLRKKHIKILFLTHNYLLLLTSTCYMALFYCADKTSEIGYISKSYFVFYVIVISPLFFIFLTKMILRYLLGRT